jgi:DNA polymerase-1
MLQAQAERMAVNAPIQGTAADIMKLAMIHIYRDLPSVSPRSRLLLQVHDEVIVEAPADEAERVAEFLQSTMQHVADLAVPLLTEVGIGKNWGEAK